MSSIESENKLIELEEKREDSDGVKLGKAIKNALRDNNEENISNVKSGKKCKILIKCHTRKK